MMLCGCGSSILPAGKAVDTRVRISPQYDSVTIPTSIAPLNFVINEQGDRYYAELTNSRGESIVIYSDEPTIEIPKAKWAQFCKKSEGTQYQVRVSVERSGEWNDYPLMVNFFSADPIDSHIVYRLIYPGYTLWDRMGIYERQLSSFDQRTIIDNQSNEQGCMNCHTFSNNSPERMMLHIRKNRGGTVVAKDGKAQKLTTKTGTMASEATYSTWSRDGRYIAYSVNDVRQSFHTSSPKAIEVYDLKSDLVVYDTQTGEMITDPEIYSPTYMETFPEWSADGKYIYFCRTAPYPNNNTSHTSSRYDLCRISFENGVFGKVELIYNAAEQHKSVSFPKCSPDGKWLVFTQSNYGTFSIWHPESDLWLMDLNTNAIRPISEINSDNVESYHSWSSNGKWLTFSSKRIDGLWARPFFASFDNGTFGKPFVLPQQSPNHYDTQMESYNLPVFVTSKVEISSDIISAVQSDPTTVKAGKGVK